MGRKKLEFDRSKKYGSLTWIRDIPEYRTKSGVATSASEWKCDCGNTIILPNSSVVSGNTKSCGCRHLKHGMSKNKLYLTWTNMKRRCFDPKHKSYKDYGGRGITVCKEWLDNKTFFAWAEKSGYKDGLTIDRIDVNGNYCPENCRWVCMTVQANNKRDNRPITIDGVTKNAKQWADDAGLKWTTFQRRVDIYGMSPAEAITRQVKPHEDRFKNGLTIDGVTKTLVDWGKPIGLAGCVIANRIKTGWDPAKAVSTPPMEFGTWVKKKIAPGTRFGCLTVISETEPLVSPNGKIRSRYKCVCDCGREKNVLQQNLLGKAHTTSCGRHECRRKAKELSLEQHNNKENQ